MARTNVEKTLTMLRKLTKFDPDMTVQQIRVLIEVDVGSGETTAKEIADRMNVSGPTVSRALDLWGKYGAGEKPGRNFCERTPDPDDRRVARLSLTRSGRQFVDTLTHVN